LYSANMTSVLRDSDTTKKSNTTCKIGLIILSVVVVAAVVVPTAVVLTNKNSKSNDNDNHDFIASDYGCKRTVSNSPPSFHFTNIPARLQWEANFGYCGEVSFIQAGLSLGQYLSQYDARIAASGSTPQRLEDSQLLLGVNDEHAASKMHFDSEVFDIESTDTEGFLAWVKDQIITHQRPVVIGVYTNEYLFYEDTDPDAGNSEFDHIVLVTGVTTKHSDTAYHDDDILHIEDHGLWGSDDDIPYHFCYRFDEVQASRREANSQDSDAEVYYLPVSVNYGIAIKGIKDTNQDTVPVTISTGVNFERPVMEDGSSNRPVAMPLTITITVSEMAPNTPYNLYWYDELSNVPNSNFNSLSSQAFKSFLNIEVAKAGDVFTHQEDISSNQIVVLRAVLASAA